MEVTNYSPCNFIIQCTNKQHNPPFITWNRIFKTQLNVGRDLSKAKPDVVRRVFSKPNREECTALARFSVRVCVVRRRVGGSRSSLLWWVYMKSGCVVRSHTTPGEALSSQAEGWSSRVCGGVCGWVGRGGWMGGGEIGQTAGGVIVLPDSQTEHRSPLSALASHSPSPASQPIRLGRGLKITPYTGWDGPLKLVCSNLASELHWGFSICPPRNWTKCLWTKNRQSRGKGSFGST